MNKGSLSLLKPLPMTHDGWIPPTVALAGTGQLSREVKIGLGSLRREQKNPSR